MNLEFLFQEGILNEIDLAFGQMIHRLSGDENHLVPLAASLVSRAAANGDVCLDLETISLDHLYPKDAAASNLQISPDEWRKILSSSSAVGKGGEDKPLILEGNRLYLQRYWIYENRVAQAVIDRCQTEAILRDSLDEPPLFSQWFENEDHSQRQAILEALNNRFTVISGGPGTGKTTTIAKIILLLCITASQNSPKIVLAAPTGKAAARMQQALDSVLRSLVSDQTISLPDNLETQTLHRLLGAIPGKTQFRYNQDNPLPAEVVIVDEASMIDLALMAKLIAATAPTARLILVGDKDQLASVEAGAVLGDICAGLSTDGIRSSGQTKQTMKKKLRSSHIIVLEKSYRFDPHSGINDLARAINQGDIHKTKELLENKNKKGIDFRQVAEPGELYRSLKPIVIDGLTPLFKIKEPLEALSQLGTMQILSPLRNGPYGVKTLNEKIENFLFRENAIRANRGADAQWYPGRPVMINRNDYQHHLYNGDVGIAMAHGFNGHQKVRVAFSLGGSRLQYLAPEQLPAHETVYAMTVHKSQGTEFNKVILVLPEKHIPILTRELIYTAITRARQHVEIWGRLDVLFKAIEHRVRRASGLREALLKWK